MAYGGAGAGAAAYVIAQAIKASGAVVRMEPQDFMAILSKAEAPLVVTARGGFLKRASHYLTSYKGLAFFTKSPTPLPLTSAVEVVAAKTIWIPG